MADFYSLKELRELGVKRAVFLEPQQGSGGGFLSEVEFFEPSAPVAPFEVPDTLVPPAESDLVEDHNTRITPPSNYRVPPSLAAILAKPSVS